jgi:uncharacterized protein YecE (DUF72 family)
VPVLIGTSGWQYAHWRGRFYPSGLPAARWLEHYAERFRTVEVNNAFYRLPEKSTFENWRSRTPADFVVSVKASRYITHIKRLRDPVEPTRRLLDRARGLGTKLGPILLQFPPNLRVDAGALDELLAQFPKGVRVAVEPRHESWFSDEIAALLERRGAAFCLSDSPQRKTPYWRTAAWGYLRMHAGRATPAPCYGRAALATWAERLAELWPASASVYVYFNNDEAACALRDAQRFARAATRSGLRPSRVPSAHEISVGQDSA